MENLNFNIKTAEGDNTYVINVPTVGQYSDIEATKQILGKGFYSGIAGTNTISSVNAADMIDIEAHITILCSDLLSDLKVKSFRDLGLTDFNEIRNQYVKQFVPWWKKITDVLRNVD